MMKFCHDLFPLNRSLLGRANLETLRYIQRIIPDLLISEYKTGFQAYDWIVPNEWEILDAYIEDLQGNRLVDFAKSNLHVVGYSIAIDQILDFETLKQNLFSHDTHSDAIPYLTSYYEANWGFCLSQNQLNQFVEGDLYHVVINSRHFSGSLYAGEVVLPGETKKEILLSTYICHPSMANNELSGPAVLTALTSWLGKVERRHFTYRISFHSETLGALCYIKTNEEKLKENVIAAWNFTCMGGPGPITILPSKYGNSLPDKVTNSALNELDIEPQLKDFLTRGSDERQFSSPRLGIPMVSVMKSPYGEYSQYHSSLDNLDFIKEEYLTISLEVMKEIVLELESQKYRRQTFIGEPQLNKYGLYPKLLGTRLTHSARDIMNVLQFCDGTNSNCEISKETRLSLEETESILRILLDNELIE